MILKRTPTPFGEACKAAGHAADAVLATTALVGDAAYDLALATVRAKLDATTDGYSDEIARNIAYARTWDAKKY